MSSLILKSRSNPLVQKVRAVRDGKEKSLFFCEGLKLLSELLSSSFTTTQILCAPKMSRPVKEALTSFSKIHIPVSIVDDNLMQALSDLESPAGVIALAKRQQILTGDQNKAEGTLFLILAQVQLPQNLGALIRTSEAAGVNEVWIGPGSVDPFSPKVIRGSAGSLFRVKIHRGVSLEQTLAIMKEKNIRVRAAVQKGTVRYDQADWTVPSALVMGAEGSGFSNQEQSLFDEKISIPMAGHVESLNLGTAAAICLFEAVRQRSLT
jgi:TrmH family RNA methyltransferase